MSDADNEPDYKALLEGIRDNMIYERRLLVSQYQDEQQTDPINIVEKIVKVQGQIDALDRAILSEAVATKLPGERGLAKFYEEVKSGRVSLEGFYPDPTK